MGWVSNRRRRFVCHKLERAGYEQQVGGARRSPFRFPLYVSPNCQYITVLILYAATIARDYTMYLQLLLGWSVSSKKEFTKNLASPDHRPVSPCRASCVFFVAQLLGIPFE